MINSQSFQLKCNENKSVINIEINAKIKQLQRNLVIISFAHENNSNEYREILGKIRSLRKKIFKKE